MGFVLWSQTIATNILTKF